MASNKANRTGTVAKPIFAGALIICVALVGFSAWQTWTAVQRFDTTTNHDARLRELVGILAEADAVQTATAQAAVATWDLRWEDEFHRATARSESCAAELLELSPDTELSRAVARTHAANIKMVASAELAMDQACRGRRAAARDLLAADEFLEQQTLYREGLSRVRQLLLDRASLAHQSFRQQTFRAVAAGVAALPFLLIGYVGVFRNPGPVRFAPDGYEPYEEPASPAGPPHQDAVEPEETSIPSAIGEPDDWAETPCAETSAAIETHSLEGHGLPADAASEPFGSETLEDNNSFEGHSVATVGGEDEASDTLEAPAAAATTPEADDTEQTDEAGAPAIDTSETPDAEPAAEAPPAEEPVAETSKDEVVAQSVSESGQEPLGDFEDIEAAVAAADQAVLRAEAAAQGEEPDGDNDIDAVLTALESTVADGDNDSQPEESTTTDRANDEPPPDAPAAESAEEQTEEPPEADDIESAPAGVEEAVTDVENGGDAPETDASDGQPPVEQGEPPPADDIDAVLAAAEGAMTGAESGS